MFRSSGYFSTPPVVLNLIIINCLFFMATALLPGDIGWMIEQRLGLYFWESNNFRLYQLVTHMFLHANFSHLFMNMFALWMFGRVLEYDLGGKRFLIYYMVTGIGAALLHLGVSWIEISRIHGMIAEYGAQPDLVRALMSRVNVVTVGASGAVFGVLLAFGMMHPNSVIMLMIPPLPIKAKYFVIGYGVIELFLGISNSGGNVAHFAHVGGMLWGYLLLRWWKQKGVIFY